MHEGEIFLAMDKKTIIEETEKYYLPVFGRYPMVMELGHGCRVWDNEGNEYVDAFAGIAVNSLGYNHPVLVKAISEQAAKLMHCSNLYYTEIQVKALRVVAEATGMDRIFFANCGAEGNEGAMKLARKYGVSKAPTKYKIISADESFHGRTFDTLAATGHDYYHVGYGPLSPGHVLVPYGDIKALEAQMDDDVCAVLLEPIQGEGGVMALDPEYVQAVRALCDEKDLVLIVDEVQTGVGRTGTFLCCEHYNLKPDIVTLAKGLGGGLPIGAVLLNEKTAEGMGPGSHGSTFGGNPVVCAGANVVVDRLDQSFLAQVSERAVQLRTGLAKLPHVKSISGIGLMVGIEFFDVQAADVLAACREKGLLVLTAKTRLRLLPPLTVSEHEVDMALEVLAEVLGTMEPTAPKEQV